MEPEPNPPDSVEPIQPSPVTGISIPIRHNHAWSWLIGLLVPFLSFALVIVTGNFDAIYNISFYAFYLNQIINALFIVAMVPIILAQLLHIPGMVADFGLPSPLGFLIIAISWVLIGKGLYTIYYSHLRLMFWLIFIGVFSALLISGYIMTSDYRALAGAKATCVNLEGEMKGYCLIEAAKSLNNRSICEQISGWQRTSCYNQLGASYSPLPGMK